MVTVNQLVWTPSPIFSLIPTVSSVVQVQLDDSNYLQWRFHMELVLKGNGIMGMVDGSFSSPPKYDNDMVVTEEYKQWEQHDKALMLLISVTLSPSAMSCVIGSGSSNEMWIRLKDHFFTFTRFQIFQMKCDFLSIKKGDESIDQYLQKINDSRYQLSAVGVDYSDEDIMFLALNGLPAEYNTIKTVIRVKDSVVPLKELRSHLKAEEATIAETVRQNPILTAMFAKTNAQNFHHTPTYANASVFGNSGNSLMPSQMVSSGFPLSSGFVSDVPMQQLFQANLTFQNTSGRQQNAFTGGGGYKNNGYNNKNKGKFFDSGSNYNGRNQFHNNCNGIFGAPQFAPMSNAFQPTFQHVSLCQICFNRGHVAATCKFRPTSSGVKANPCQICHKRNHIAFYCHFRDGASTFQSPSVPMQAMATQNTSAIASPSYFVSTLEQQLTHYDINSRSCLYSNGSVTNKESINKAATYGMQQEEFLNMRKHYHSSNKGNLDHGGQNGVLCTPSDTYYINKIFVDSYDSSTNEKSSESGAVPNSNLSTNSSGSEGITVGTTAVPYLSPITLPQDPSMNEESKALQAQGKWKLAHQPYGKNSVSFTFVSPYKDGLFASNFIHVAGLRIDIFPHVAIFFTTNLNLALAVKMDWKLHPPDDEHSFLTKKAQETCG